VCSSAILVELGMRLHENEPRAGLSFVSPQFIGLAQDRRGKRVVNGRSTAKSVTSVPGKKGTDDNN
jgi:hypothetical protein